MLRQHLTSDSGRAMVLLSRSESRVTEAELATMLPPPTEFPLFFSDPADRMRFPYAAFLLNKVGMEQGWWRGGCERVQGWFWNVGLGSDGRMGVGVRLWCLLVYA